MRDLGMRLDTILNFFYIILRPMLTIAGMAMDNSLIYGSAFHLDDMLFTFWKMMTQFANYGLVMLILWNIAKSLWTNDGGKGIKDILKKAVFAGIAIQASWFFMAMMLDLSTVLVYSVGSTPLQAINNSPANRPILTNHGTMNLDDVIKMGGGENGRKSRNRYSYENNKRDPLYPDMTAGNNNFLSCVTEEYKLNEKTRNQFMTTFQAGKTTTTINTKYCVI